MADLADVQRLLWRLITAPEGAAAGRSAIAEKDPQAVSVFEAAIAGDDRLSAIERVDIYANMYFYRLLDCLRLDYPAVAVIAAEAEFHNLVTDYLLAHPPAHWSLRYAGAHLPQFLRAHRLAVEHPHLPDVAQLEWTIVDVFDSSDEPVLGTLDLAGVAPEAWADLRFTLVSSARLLDFAWNAGEAWEAATENATALAAAAHPHTHLVWRRDLRVYHRPLDEEETAALRGLAAGERFGDVCQAVADASRGRDAAGKVAGLLGRWINDGLLRAAVTR